MGYLDCGTGMSTRHRFTVPNMCLKPPDGQLPVEVEAVLLGFGESLRAPSGGYYKKPSDSLWSQDTLT